MDEARWNEEAEMLDVVDTSTAEWEQIWQLHEAHNYLVKVEQVTVDDILLNETYNTAKCMAEHAEHCKDVLKSKLQNVQREMWSLLGT